MNHTVPTIQVLSFLYVSLSSDAGLRPILNTQYEINEVSETSGREGKKLSFNPPK